MKRVFDLILASAALALLAPVMVLIAAAVKLTDGGPIIFRQTRVGRHGKLFSICKFRTMVPNAEQLGPMLTAANDTRVTSVGRWLRKTKLDELPQLFNVIKGDMSMVGPRPEVPRYVALYDAEQRRVLDVRPGITDPASIRYFDEAAILADSTDPEGIYTESILPEKIRINLAYADGRRSLDDLRVVVLTVMRIVRWRRHNADQSLDGGSHTLTSSSAIAGRSPLNSGPGRSLRRGVLWMSAGRIVYSACQLGILAVLFDFGSLEAVGEYVLGLAITGPIVAFCNLQLRVVLATDVEHEVPWTDYRLLRNVMLLVAMVAISAAATLLDVRSGTAGIILAAGVSKLVESLSDLQYGRLQRCECVHIVARSMLIRGPTAVIAAYIAYSLFGDVAAVFLAISLAWLLVLLAHDAPLGSINDIQESLIRRDDTRRRLSRQGRFRSLALNALPLGVAEFLSSIEANVPRYAVVLFFDEQALGIVGAMTYLLALAQAGMTVLTYPMMPRLAVLSMQSNLHSFSRLLWRLVRTSALVGFAVFIVSAFQGERLLRNLFGAELTTHFELFLIIVAACIVQMVLQLLLAALRAMRRFRTVFILQGMSLPITTALCVAMLKLAGLSGVGWAILAASSLHTGVAALLIRDALCRKKAKLASANATHAFHELGAPRSVNTLLQQAS